MLLRWLQKKGIRSRTGILDQTPGKTKKTKQTKKPNQTDKTLRHQVISGMMVDSPYPHGFGCVRSKTRTWPLLWLHSISCLFFYRFQHSRWQILNPIPHLHLAWATGCLSDFSLGAIAQGLTCLHLDCNAVVLHFTFIQHLVKEGLTRWSQSSPSLSSFLEYLTFEPISHH